MHFPYCPIKLNSHHFSPNVSITSKSHISTYLKATNPLLQLVLRDLNIFYSKGNKKVMGHYKIIGTQYIRTWQG